MPLTATVSALAIVAALRFVVVPDSQTSADTAGDSAAVPTTVIAADADGGLSVTLERLPYRLEAPAGTFPANHLLEIGAAEETPDLGTGRLLLPAVSITSTVQPTQPVTVETIEPLDIPDISAATAAVWEPDVNLPEALAIEQLDDGRVRTRVPHFSAFGLFSFPSLEDLIPFQVTGAIGLTKDLFNFPFDCSTPSYASALLTPDGHPASVHLQVDAVDKDVGAGTVTLPICNRLRTVMHYVSSGAGSTTGYALPRSEFPNDVHLRGSAGDQFTLTARLDREAAIATVALLTIDALPSGKAIASKLIKDGILDSGTLTLIVNIGFSCGSAIDAALARPTARSWDAALSCLKNLESFSEAIAQWAAETAVAIGLDVGVEAAARLVPVINWILGSHVYVRFLAEWAFFDPPREVAFPFRLWCGHPAACPFATRTAPPNGQTQIPESGSGDAPTIPPDPGGQPDGGGPCPNGMEGPGPGPDGTSGCYVPGTDPQPGNPGTPGPSAPHIVRASMYTEGVLVYLSLTYSDPDGDAVGFGFRGPLWAEETQSFASTGYGRASPGRIDYPFNHGCGTPSQISSDVEAWINDSTGLQSESVTLHLTCSL
jgi:hypothetical protein